jgi:hypothetical protein
MAAFVKAAKVFLILVFGSGKQNLKLNVGDLNGDNIDSKDAAHSEVQKKVGNWEDQTLIDACYAKDDLVFARNLEGDHEITCTIPPDGNGGNKKRKKSKKTKKKKQTKKRKTMKKK